MDGEINKGMSYINNPETLTYKDLLAVMAQHEVAYQRHEAVLTRQEELMAKHSDLLADVMQSIGQLFQRIPVSSLSPAPRPPPIDVPQVVAEPRLPPPKPREPREPHQRSSSLPGPNK